MTELNADTVTIASYGTLVEAYRKADAFLASWRYQRRLLDELTKSQSPQRLSDEQHTYGYDHLNRMVIRYCEFRRLISSAIIILDGRLYQEHPLDAFRPADALIGDDNYLYAVNIINADDAPDEDACVTAAKLKEHMTPNEIDSLIRAMHWLDNHEETPA